MTTCDREYFDARFAQLETLIQKSVADVKAEVRSELHTIIVSTVKWCASIAATTVLVFTTVVAFLMNNAVPRVPQAPAAPAPTVIVVPPIPAGLPPSSGPQPGPLPRG